jgi:hypothetical protein
MLHVPVGSQSFGSAVPSWGTTRPATGMGVACTPGTTGYGSWVQVASATAADTFGLLICFNNGFTSATARNIMANIGIDIAGGSSYAVLAPDLIAGAADAYTATGRSGNGIWYYFPIFIPAGSTIGVQGWASNASTFYCGVVPYQRAMNPAQFRKGSYIISVGSYSQPRGVALTPGTLSDGAWVSLGTTSARAWWWQIGYMVNSSDTSWTAGVHHVDLAVGNGSTKDLIIQDLAVQVSASECSSNPPLSAGVEWDVPAGSTLYIRSQSSGTPDSALYALVYGCGG